jgi:RNase P/RNase MRP subunit p30
MKVKGILIYRCQRSTKPKYPFLVTSDKISDLTTTSTIDIISLNDMYLRFEDKRRITSGIGLEINVSDLRRADGKYLGKWLAEISSLYKYCKHTGIQFILSSGATSICELISGRCFDSLLKTCEIEPKSYWNELDAWLQSRLLKRRIILA